jgi:hypothetical protein
MVGDLLNNNCLVCECSSVYLWRCKSIFLLRHQPQKCNGRCQKQNAPFVSRCRIRGCTDAGSVTGGRCSCSGTKDRSVIAAPGGIAAAVGAPQLLHHVQVRPLELRCHHFRRIAQQLLQLCLRDPPCAMVAAAAADASKGAFLPGNNMGHENRVHRVVHQQARHEAEVRRQEEDRSSGGGLWYGLRILLRRLHLLPRPCRGQRVAEAVHLAAQNLPARVHLRRNLAVQGNGRGGARPVLLIVVCVRR